MSAPSSAPGLAGQTSAAIDQFRTVAKWLVGAFASVGALLVAGLQLTSLGSASGGRLLVAILGLAVATAGVMVAVLGLTSVLEPGISGPDDAARDADDPLTPLGSFYQAHRGTILPPGVESAKELVQAYGGALTAPDQASDAGKTRTRALRAPLADLVAWSSYFDSQRRFNQSRQRAAWSAVAVVAGAGLYAWAATEPAAKEPTAAAAPAVAANPVTAHLQLTAQGGQTFAGLLTATCRRSMSKAPGAPVIALGADANQTTLVLVPTRTCTTPARLSVQLDDGLVTAATVKLITSPQPKKTK